MTSRFSASTLLDVYRDNSGLPASGAFDGYDDPADSVTPVATGLPAHLVLTNSKTNDPVAGRVTIIETWTGRLRPGADVRPSDRVRDQKTGYWFVVDHANAPPLVIGAADVKLSLTRVTR